MTSTAESHATNEYWPQIAVAAVDVLGVRALVAKGDECNAAAVALGLLARNASARWVYESTDLASPRKSLYELDTYFGDSVYLFGDPAEQLDAQVLGLIVRVASLIAVGLSTDTRILLRGCVAVGDLRRRVVVSDGGSREIRIGTSMVIAHEFEQRQHWVGGAVAPNVPLNAEAMRWVAAYPVPMKGAMRPEVPPVAINWVAAGRSAAEIEERIRLAVHGIGESADALEKLANTREFVRHVHRERLFPPMAWPDA